ncbi:HEPN domain-containing protein [Methanobacterium oryzae]|uniref:HEPN domain-containing protein n=1 Tax=Methanobacterium oryzae TaxID=69540 RepID=UPI003D2264E1
MKYQIDRYKKGNIVQICIDSELIEKEINEARYDLKSAENSINNENYKWAIVQSYYSMFHAFRGLLFSRGYREKSHAGLKFAIKTLFVNNGIISDYVFADFDFAMNAREMADYSYIYDEEIASNMLESTKKLIDEVENLL